MPRTLRENRIFRRSWWPLLLVSTLAGCNNGKSEPEAVDLKSAGRVTKRGEAKQILGMTFRGDRVADKDLPGLTQFKHLRELVLQECPGVSDAGLKEIAKVETLESLELLHIKITDDGLAALAGLKKLRSLSLMRTSITGNGLAALAGLPLEKLSISGAALTADGLKNILKLKGLKELEIRAQKIGPTDLPDLKLLGELRKLNIVSTPTNDETIKQLTGLPKLEEVVLDVAALTNVGLKTLAGNRQLSTIRITESKVTDAGLAALTGLTKLKTLIVGKGVTDAGLAHLAQIKTLEHFDASSSVVTGTGLEHLHAHPGLKTVDLPAGHLSKAGRTAATAFLKATPGCRVYSRASSGAVEELK